ncbi:hypothetical protein A2970_02145 [Candidatus Roizmanbacteria bacterium RIFCSPLOWO2_01_FULL_44_13]|uniref:Uncharacterized protein n=1 Tax=Candidatus Roizmanbacteria bacterium RIFCSPLOWO2_01_FULL_44_13 TaxID=1802069 RepID=A0A1F7JBA6_9BACT|nr:MAG: hypothetical protein A2970_02145 [Candidatus Roizmanbacteria bacterium RIFCSPLOWO2_01_FULL_44_13]
MRIEIDQSGKIEQTQWNTIISLSNEIRYSIILNKKIKRRLQTKFRNYNKPRMFVYQVFSALISIIFKEVKPKSKVIIDLEYFGQRDLLIVQITKYIKQLKITPIPIFDFGFVGKNSPAHHLAQQVAYKKKAANKKVGFAEISRLIWPRKNDRVSTD